MSPRRTEITRTGLYLEPSTRCSERCKLCYTAHREQHLLPIPVIQRAVEIMVDGQDTLGIFWCGLGEVFEDVRFVGTLAELDTRWPGRLLHVVQTNGQTLQDLPDPANKVALVSLDLPRAFNDENRGKAYWDRAVRFAARHLAAGGQGVGIKCLLTRGTAPAVERSFQALQRRWEQLTGLRPADVRYRSWLEPIIPFPRREISRIVNPAFVQCGGDEDPAALLVELERTLPFHHTALRDRPRTLELSVTARGLFSCCEAVIPIGTHADLEHLDRDAVLARLEAVAPACEACPLEAVC